MSLFLTTLIESGEAHEAEPVDAGFLISPKPGMRDQFDSLARRILDRQDLLSLPQRDCEGLYEAVYIIPLIDFRSSHHLE